MKDLVRAGYYAVMNIEERNKNYRREVQIKVNEILDYLELAVDTLKVLRLYKDYISKEEVQKISSWIEEINDLVRELEE